MPADEIAVDSTALDLALARTISESKRFPDEVIKEAARGIVRLVIGITPPASITKGDVTDDGSQIWNVVLGGQARMQGQRKILANLSHIYGTPRQAMEVVKQAGDATMAKGFWAHFKQGEFNRANELLRYVNGGDPGFYEFDDGALHRRLGRGARKKAQPYFYTYEEQELKDYVKEIIARVGWLASGWNIAAVALGVIPPAWILRHGAPGSVHVETTEFGISIVMTNKVRFAGEVKGWERRIQYAMDKQADRMTNRSAKFMLNALKKEGFDVIGL